MGISISTNISVLRALQTAETNNSTGDEFIFKGMFKMKKNFDLPIEDFKN
jgi:hypothetical protein